MLPVEKKVAENKYSLDEMRVVQQDLGELLVNFEKQSKGPAKTRVLAQLVPKTVNKVMECANRSNHARMEKLDSDYKQKVTQLEEKMGLNAQELERLADIEKTVKAQVCVLFAKCRFSYHIRSQ